jgi:hypothetical protein
MTYYKQKCHFYFILKSIVWLISIQIDILKAPNKKNGKIKMASISRKPFLEKTINL